MLPARFKMHMELTECLKLIFKGGTCPRFCMHMELTASQQNDIYWQFYPKIQYARGINLNTKPMPKIQYAYGMNLKIRTEIYI
jgi:hypothetical protein